MASRMLNDADVEREDRLGEPLDLEPALSPATEELLDWLDDRERSVQEVAEQLRLLGDGERDVVVDHLSVSTLYGREFVSGLESHDTRFRHRKSRMKVDQTRYRREVPEGFQKVLVNIQRLQSLGRNVFAMTPEMLPEDVLRLWPAARPLPELVVINMDHEVPRVSVVRRLPSAGGIKLQRGALKSMTGVVAKVLGKPEELRKAAAREGLAVEHPFERVDVSLTEIAWSPQLELGELLYDWEQVQVQDEDELHDEEQTLEARGVVDASAARLIQNADLVDDLEDRLRVLGEGWSQEKGTGAREAEGRVASLAARREAASQNLVELDRERLELARDLGQEEAPELDARMESFQADMEAMETETAELAREVADEERQHEVHRRAVEDKRIARVAAEAAEEPEAEDGRRIEKAMADPAERELEEEEDRA